MSKSCECDIWVTIHRTKLGDHREIDDRVEMRLKGKFEMSRKLNRREVIVSGAASLINLFDRYVPAKAVVIPPAALDHA